MRHCRGTWTRPKRMGIDGPGGGTGGWAAVLNKRVREDLLERVPP